MKKIIAVTMVILTVMSLTIMAQAEVKLKGFGWDYKGGDYVVLISETGETAKLYVTEEEQNEYLREEFRKAEEEAKSQSWWGRLMNVFGV